MPDVDIQYNGASIATMSASGTKTLLNYNLDWSIQELYCAIEDSYSIWRDEYRGKRI